jgi:hypothetical protein
VEKEWESILIQAATVLLSEKSTSILKSITLNAKLSFAEDKIRGIMKHKGVRPRIKKNVSYALKMENLAAM